ncbi:hypothetical protein [Methylobacterium sp. JK268]
MFEPNVVSAITWSWFGDYLQSFLPHLYSEIEKDIKFGNSKHNTSVDIKNLIRHYLPDAIIDIEDQEILDLSFDSSKIDPNSMRMLYKIWRVNEIKKSLERKQGFKFDFVIRMRTDFLLNKIDELTISTICDDRNVFVDSIMNGEQWSGDSLAIGKSHVIDYYSGIFGKLVLDRGNWDYIHRELARHLHESGIQYRRYPYHDYIAPDKKSNAADVVKALLIQRSEGKNWSPDHEISLASLQIQTCLENGDLSTAESKLEEILSSDTISVSSKDSLFFVIGEMAAIKKSYIQSFKFYVLSIAARYKDPIGEQWNVLLKAAKVASELSYFLTLENVEALADQIIDCSLEGILTDRNVVNIFRSMTLGRYDVEKTIYKMLACKFFLDNYVREFVEKSRGSEAVSELALSISYMEADEQEDKYRLAEHHKNSGHYLQAYYIQRAAINLDESRADAKRQFAEICAYLGKWSEAHQAAVGAFDIHSTVEHAIVLAATSLVSKDDQNFLRAMKLVPSDPADYVEQIAFPNLHLLWNDAFLRRENL